MILYTNIYTVPPNFLTAEPGGSVWRDANDPFAPGYRPAQQRSAKEVLEAGGITFGEGCSAIYNPGTSQLIIRNTQDQMKLVEAYIDSIVGQVEKQIYVTVREIRVDKDIKNRLLGNQFSDETLKKERVPLLNSEERAWAFESFRDFERELTSPPRDLKKLSHGKNTISAQLTDPQFQVLIRALSQEKGVGFGFVAFSDDPIRAACDDSVKELALRCSSGFGR